MRDESESAKLTISLVVYRPDRGLLEATLESLRVALVDARAEIAAAELTIIDNTEPGSGAAVASDAALDALRADGVATRILAGHGNIGFGRGHNLALDHVGRHHLILNPDVEMRPDALRVALAFVREHPDCGLLSPAAWSASGDRQYLCRRYPGVVELCLRGFAPRWLRNRFERRLAYHEMRDVADDPVVRDPPLVSGCFMLFRGDVLQALGGFDPRFFLYFEDYDLSLRAAGITRLVSVSAVRIVHHGGGAARKGARHILMFARSAFSFFMKHGWR